MWTEWLARTLRPRRDEAAEGTETRPRKEQPRLAAPPERDGEDDRALLAALEEE